MPVENINLNLILVWVRPSTVEQLPYSWGDQRGIKHDPIWGRSDLIYRWVRSSDGAVAYIGIPEDRALDKRISSYMNGKSWPKGSPNRKLYDEQQRLSQINDFLFLEIVDQVQGYNLPVLRERRLAEALLIGYYRPYLQ